jgi:hypothetical protein
MVKRVLMVAYHYPPVQVSSGLQRTLAFSKYIREHGWAPIVLSANPRAYANVSTDQLQDIPSDIPVVRAFALDTSKHLSIGGRYLDTMALPDRWSSWWLGGVWSGLRIIRKYKPKLIWSTYPIATAHLIGLTLHKLTGLPWVADFRDSMTEPTYPREGARRKVFLWIEKRTVHACSKAVFTTPGAVKMYRERYPDLPDDKWLLMPNGYNEEIFSEIENAGSSCEPRSLVSEDGPITLVHSGVIYPDERDPKPFFQAISELKGQCQVNGKGLKIILRATGHDEQFRPILEELSIQDIVSLEPGIPYRDALKEMLSADGLIIFQAANCNHQVPAKVYEYFRARKPVLALTDVAGDTAKTLADAGLTDIAPLDDSELIKQTLLAFIAKLESGSAAIASDEAVQKYSRQAAARLLAEWFDTILQSNDSMLTDTGGR